MSCRRRWGRRRHHRRFHLAGGRRLHRPEHIRECAGGWACGSGTAGGSGGGVAGGGFSTETFHAPARVNFCASAAAALLLVLSQSSRCWNGGATVTT